MSHKTKIGLSNIEIFYGLTSQQIKNLEGSCQQKYYQRDDQIIDQQSATQEVYFISKGSVRVVNLTTSGKEVTLEVLKPGMCFGELSAIDGGLRSSSVIAIEPSVLISMPAKIFLKTLENYPSIGLKVMIMLASVIRTSSDRITDLVTLGANARVLNELIKKIEEVEISNNTAVIDNFPFHNEIARRASTTRETVTRVLSTLTKKDIIRRHGKAIEILDVAVLERTFENLSDSDI